MNSQILDMKEYRLGGVRISSLYPVIPRGKGAADFDIYDYGMLFDDPATVELIRTGKTIGCFYIESPGMRSLLQRLDVTTFEMLTAASSIIRPGVAESGMMKEFIDRHKNPRLRKYLVPEMETYLGETYGVMIYQEDVIKVAHHIAGLPLEEADLIRRAMSGKMRSREAMKTITDKFFGSCKEKGLNRYVAKELWRQIESFAGYSFCKAHSASFALLSFQVAFLKVHYPAEFMASVLSNGGGYYSSAVYIQECRRLGLEVNLPCVNRSGYEYIGRGGTIRIGLMAVRNLSHDSIDKIVEERSDHGPYVSLMDFIVRTGIGIQETTYLIKCGAMNCFGETRPTMLRLLDIYFRKRRILDESYSDLFTWEAFDLENEIKTARDYSIEEKCRAEYESFDYMVTRHPLEFFADWTGSPSIIKAADIPKYHGRKVKMIGWYMASKRIRTRKGDIMKFLSLEDLTGTFEAVIFPGVYMKVAQKTLSMGPYLLEGRVDAENGGNLIVDDLELLSHIDLKASVQKDTAEEFYTPDDEGFREEELYSRHLNTEALVKAYTG